MEISKQQAVEIINQTPATDIAELDFVKQKFIANYNATHKDKNGELQYSKQMVHFKQLVHGSQHLAKCNKFSLYACFLTCAVNGYSLDPADNEVYLVPIKDKCNIWKQAGAHVKRLMRTDQIIRADQAVLVYDGDEFEVEMGRVIKHNERFQSEVIKYAYIRFVIGKDRDGNETDKFFIYRKTDWNFWKKKSMVPNGENWSGNDGQPMPAFLKTKVTKHACMDASWATGALPASVQTFDVEIEDVNEVAEAIVVHATENANMADAEHGNIDIPDNDAPF